MKTVLTNTAGGLSFMETISIVFLILCFILPSMSHSFGHFNTFVLSFFYLCLSSGVNKRIKIVWLKLCTLACVVSLLYLLLSNNPEFALNLQNRNWKIFISIFSQIFLMIVCGYMFKRVEEHASASQINFFVILSFILLIWVQCLTISELALNPDAVKSWKRFDEHHQNNIATYYMIYAFPMLTVALAGIAKFCNSKTMKILIYTYFAFSFFFLFASAYVLSIIATIIGCGYWYASQLKSAGIRIMCFLILIMLYFTIPTCLEFLASSTDSVNAAARLREIGNFLSGGGIGYNLGARLEIYWGTIIDFIQSPLVGNEVLSVHGHSTFLNTFAYLGIFGGLLYCNIYRLLYIETSQYMRAYRPIFICVMITLVTVGLTNPINMSLPLNYITWFLIPLLLTKYNYSHI